MEPYNVLSIKDLHLTVSYIDDCYYYYYYELCYCYIGTFPYEVSQSPLPSGSHMFTAFQSEPGEPGVIQTGATQFLLPRKQWIKRITIIAKGHFPLAPLILIGVHY